MLYRCILVCFTASDFRSSVFFFDIVIFHSSQILCPFSLYLLCVGHHIWGCLNYFVFLLVYLTIHEYNYTSLGVHLGSFIFLSGIHNLLLSIDIPWNLDNVFILQCFLPLFQFTSTTNVWIWHCSLSIPLCQTSHQL
jgi:hypothetical protein